LPAVLYLTCQQNNLDSVFFIVRLLSTSALLLQKARASSTKYYLALHIVS